MVVGVADIAVRPHAHVRELLWGRDQSLQSNSARRKTIATDLVERLAARGQADIAPRYRRERHQKYQYLQHSYSSFAKSGQPA